MRRFGGDCRVGGMEEMRIHFIRVRFLEITSVE